MLTSIDYVIYYSIYDKLGNAVCRQYEAAMLKRSTIISQLAGKMVAGKGNGYWQTEKKKTSFKP